jgi:hypothetical protein
MPLAAPNFKEFEQCVVMLLDDEVWLFFAIGLGKSRHILTGENFSATYHSPKTNIILYSTPNNP